MCYAPSQYGWCSSPDDKRRLEADQFTSRFLKVVHYDFGIDYTRQYLETFVVLPSQNRVVYRQNRVVAASSKPPSTVRSDFRISPKLRVFSDWLQPRGHKPFPDSGVSSTSLSNTRHELAGEKYLDDSAAKLHLVAWAYRAKPAALALPLSAYVSIAVILHTFECG